MAATAWLQASRYQFSTSVTLISILGTAVAWEREAAFSAPVFLVVVGALIADQVALHLSDDYFDFLQGVDTVDPQRCNPYAGGSKVLPNGLLEPRAVAWAFSALYGATLAAGVYLVLLKGWSILALGLFGAFCSFFYSAPPVKLAYRGLGELAIGLNYGPVIGLGAYLVQVLPARGGWRGLLTPSPGSLLSSLPVEVLLVVLPLGAITFSMIVVQEIADYEEDRRAGKRTLVVRLGKRAGVMLHTTGLLVAYAALVAAVEWGGAPKALYVALLGLPACIRSIRTFWRTYREPALVERAVADFVTFRLHSLTGILMIFAYCVSGLTNGRPAWQCAVIAVCLMVSYGPVAIGLFARVPVSDAGFVSKCLYLAGWDGPAARVSPSHSLPTTRLGSERRVAQ